MCEQTDWRIPYWRIGSIDTLRLYYWLGSAIAYSLSPSYTSRDSSVIARLLRRQSPTHMICCERSDFVVRGDGTLYFQRFTARRTFHDTIGRGRTRAALNTPIAAILLAILGTLDRLEAVHTLAGRWARDRTRGARRLWQQLREELRLLRCDWAGREAHVEAEVQIALAAAATHWHTPSAQPAQHPWSCDLSLAAHVQVVTVEMPQRAAEACARARTHTHMQEPLLSERARSRARDAGAGMRCGARVCTHR